MEASASALERALADRVAHRVQAAGHDVPSDTVLGVVRSVLKRLGPESAREDAGACIHVFVVETDDGAAGAERLRGAVAQAAERYGGRLLASHAQRTGP